MRRRWSLTACALLGASGLVACSEQHGEDAARRGQAALQAQDLPTARQAFEDALAKDPADPLALKGLGWALLMMGEREAGLAAFEDCAARLDDAPECLRGIASASLALGDLNRAKVFADAAVSTTPPDAVEPHRDALYTQGLVILATDKLPEAEARFEELVGEAPDKVEYRLGLAEALVRQQEGERALGVVEDALAMQGLTPRTHGMLLVLRAKAHHRSTAKSFDPNDCEATLPLVFASLDKAAASLDEALTLGIELPEVDEVRANLDRRRQVVQDHCAATMASPPPSAASDGKSVPD